MANRPAPLSPEDVRTLLVNEVSAALLAWTKANNIVGPPLRRQHEQLKVEILKLIDATVMHSHVAAAADPAGAMKAIVADAAPRVFGRPRRLN